ncbi:type I glyceraldehyde-3-phosphate dehydrogenase [bacterium]|nr:type I glyceraldehyde-3-phosphate dehydrogenase [bacterium]PIV82038.1 MAG: type I glyceraldehyde-3-phosphate dehydrogenase [bacterium CG17_big_fil_post_rev_8_21_14_2_50_64_8]PJA76055.1 MAG: type I glyceraldehyde-3-phosphate dehydrogenase [bacterium CG_4_9_14_3_um_filter_65_15]
MRIAINGFGRIGRSVFRLLNDKEGVEVVAINDLADSAALVYLLRHDTVMGNFQGVANLEGDVMVTKHQKVKMTEVSQPTELPWGEMGIDFVVEATGRFRKRAEIAQHIEAGARKVLLTVPAKDEIDATIVLGVNHEDLKPEHLIVSNASCTTNCLAPLAYVLDKEFGIEYGLMTTVHAYTNDQRLADVPHTDWRRSRAAAENTIPTTTGAARAVGKVLPQLAGKLDGMAMRVPVPDGSVVDLVTILSQDVTVQQVRDAVRDHAASDRLRSIMLYSEEPLVSSDIVGDPHSSIFDSEYTSVIGGNMLKTLSWYDNEWGYSNRVVDLLDLMDSLG